MSKAQFEAARQLIRDGHYDQARELLKTINHPQAQQWLNTLDERDPPKRRRHVLRWVLLAIILVLGGTLAINYAIQNNTCSARVRRWWDQVDPLVVKFLDTAETAASTSRIAISPIIIQLQDLQRQVDALPDEPCAVDITAMNSVSLKFAVDGFNAFAGSNESLANIYFTAASQALWNTNAMLRPYLVFPDTRMQLAHFIWGGDEATAARATETAATITPTAFNPVPTFTPTPSQSSLVPSVTPIPITMQPRSFACPANCEEARDRGISAEAAAACGLDRDRDGVACYGD